jgi:hypothetical protein
MSVGEGNLNKPVSSIVIHSAMAKMGTADTTTVTAHFRIFLQPFGGSSVELNSYGLQQTKTVLKITFRPQGFSTTPSMMGIVTIPAERSFTVSDVVTTLLKWLPLLVSGCHR